jgi:hypothetical protein
MEARLMGQSMRALRRRLTYANVMATVAVFLALGGGAYAAIKLPRNSVGQRQLRNGSVGASELKTGAVRGRAVKDRSIGVAELSTSARESLRGQQGPAGAPGVPFRAVIASSGDPAAGNATGIQHAPGSNEYLVRFPSDVSSCTAIATLGDTAGEAAQIPPAGRITVTPTQGAVLVRTYDAAGSPSPASFHLAVSC